MSGPLLKAIRKFNSRRELATKLGISPERLNAWLNRGINIPKHYAEMIEQLTDGEITWQALVPHLAYYQQNALQNSDNDSLFCEAVNLSLSRIRHCWLADAANDKVYALLEDIKQHGLQKPICVDAENQLIFGKTRLHAYELLDKKTIPAWRLSLPDLISGKYHTENLTKIFSISERVAIGLAIEKQMGKRQGQRTDLTLRRHADEVKGRTDVLTAALMGFGGKDSYRYAKKIQVLGTPELIEAVDQQRFTLSTATQLLQLPAQQQRITLALSDKEVIAISKQIKTHPQLNTDPTLSSSTIPPQENMQHA